MGLTRRKTSYVDKARAKHMEKVQAMDDLPAQELNPPEIPEPPQPVSTPKNQADVEGQGIRRDDQVHGEGAQGGPPMQRRRWLCRLPMLQLEP